MMGFEKTSSVITGPSTSRRPFPFRVTCGGMKREKLDRSPPYVLTSVGTKTDVWATGFQQGYCESFGPDESRYESFLL